MTNPLPQLTDTEFGKDILRAMFGTRQGGVKILIDAKDAALGVGKTSAGICLARYFAWLFDYDLQPEDFVLSPKAYMNRFGDHPGKDQPSVIMLDEMVGAGGGDARRSMAEQNVNLGRIWQLSRAKRIVTITTLASIWDADKRLRKLADYRVLCHRDTIGQFDAYRMGTFDFGGGSDVKFKHLSLCRFPDMDGDKFYEHLADRKTQLNDSQTNKADELLEDESKDNSKSEKDYIRGWARDLARQGVEQPTIAERIPNNPETGEPFHQSTISRWTSDIEATSSGGTPA
jgi:hypothetical protein